MHTYWLTTEWSDAQRIVEIKQDGFFETPEGTCYTRLLGRTPYSDRWVELLVQVKKEGEIQWKNVH